SNFQGAWCCDFRASWELEVGSWRLAGNGLIFQSGQIHVADVFLHHAPRAEAGEYRSNRLLDDLQPAARHAVTIAVIEGRNDLLFENRIQRLRVGPVLRALVAGVGLAFNQPPVVAGESFGPPAVADRQV